MSEWPTEVWGVLIALVGGVAGVAGKVWGSKTDNAVRLVDGAFQLTDQLQEERDRIEGRLCALEVEQRRERLYCERRIEQLVGALRREGIDVPPPPPREG